MNPDKAHLCFCDNFCIQQMELANQVLQKDSSNAEMLVLSAFRQGGGGWHWVEPEMALPFHPRVLDKSSLCAAT